MSDKTTDPLAIFKAGVAAGLRGDDPRSCPWNKMTAAWNEWQRGQTWGIAARSSDGCPP